jgi:hypothetical protein
MSLYHGKMGIVLSFAHYARYTGETIYEEFADELLGELINDINDEVPINFENGLCGIGWGIEHLIENGFIKGNSDEILVEIDNKIMEWDISRIKDRSIKSGLAGLYHYVSKRINSTNNHRIVAPFDEKYIRGWNDINIFFTQQNDVTILLNTTGNTPGNNLFYEWELGIKDGCAGYLLNIIFNKRSYQNKNKYI